MIHNDKKEIEKTEQQKKIPTISRVFDDGSIMEMIYCHTKRQTGFIVWKDGAWREEASVFLDPTHQLIPYSPHNNLIKNQIVLFPSYPEEYASEKELLSYIQGFIHRYVDVSPFFEKIASYYVLFSWVYDSFNELPYLRFRGDYGCGKTRSLLTIGSLCYKPIFASGASSVSPLFRMLESFRGTLIIDEGDFRFSDETSEMVKILNNGNAKGFPVLRSEVSGNKEFNPRAYAVFGPKLVGTRGFYKDRALESRFITEEMGQRRLREDVPINLPSSHKEEALHLRNKLLLFRFRNLGKQVTDDGLVDRSIEPRLNQIFVPLLSIIADEKMRAEIREVARAYNKEIIIERGMDMEAQILEILKDMTTSSIIANLGIKETTNWFIDRFGEDYDRKITTKWIGYVVRKKLKLKTQKSNGVYVIPQSEKPKLERLYEKYGIGQNEYREEEGETPF